MKKIYSGLNVSKNLFITLLFIAPFFLYGQNQRIVNGDPIAVEQAPWQAWLDVCGGSVIDENWVLTAAHCGIRNGSQITFGQTYKSLGGTQTRKAVQVITHPNYQSVDKGYDVCLIKLDKPLDLTDPKVSKIRIATVRDKESGLTDPGTRVICTGWGKTGTNGTSPDQLQKIDIPIVDDNSAKEEIGQYSTNTMLPTGPDGQAKSACYGDSGGPLAIKSESGNVLVGVVSWGISCKGITLFARVSSFAQWIYDNTGITDHPTSIEGQKNSNISLALAPNPNNGSFNIIANNIEGSSMHISAYDLQGKMVFGNQFSVTEGIVNHKIDLNNLNKGVYFLNIKASNGNATSRLVIK